MSSRNRDFNELHSAVTSSQKESSHVCEVTFSDIDQLRRQDTLVHSFHYLDLLNRRETVTLKPVANQ